MNINFSTTVNEVVMNNLKAAKVLSQYDIDLLTDGKRSLGDVCREANISFGSLIRRIRNAPAHRRCTIDDADSVELDKLVSFIERYHHRDLADKLAFLRPNLARLVRLHGSTHSDLEEINAVFRQLAAHLTVHMKHEEMILFPYIRKMVRRRKKVRSDIYKSVLSPIAAMEDDHGAERTWLKKLEELTHHYTVPGDATVFYNITYSALRELEEDLYSHMRLENEVLFPKALEIEAKLNAKH